MPPEERNEKGTDKSSLTEWNFYTHKQKGKKRRLGRHGQVCAVRVGVRTASFADTAQ